MHATDDPQVPHSLDGEPGDGRFEALADRWLEVQRALAPAMKAASESYQGESHALMLLSGSDGGMTPSELGVEMRLTAGRVSNLVGQLESKGLARRVRAADDLRKVVVTVTPAGAKRADDAYAQNRARLALLFGRLGVADSSELVRIAHRLAALLAEDPDLWK